MKLNRVVGRFCSNALTRYRHFSQLEAQELITKSNPLRDALLQQIDHFGQLKLEKYWKAALTDPEHGYYSKKNAFSKEGDFTTSPEISSLFGEMVGVWIAYFLQKIKILKETSGPSNRFRIVELGGGRGWLMRDIIKTLNNVSINNNFDIVFVEASELNRKSQQEAAIDQFKRHNHFFQFQHKKSTDSYEQFISENEEKNVKLSWHSTLEGLLQADMESEKSGQVSPCTIFVMNEFMDALPAAVLKFTEEGWREKVLKKSSNSNLFFDLVVSDRPLPGKMTPLIENPSVGQQIQMSPTSLLTMDLMAKIISRLGGCIINIDYGDDGVFSDSIRAIKQHKYIPAPYFWQIPGECDLSAYVSFSSLADFAKENEGIVAYETIPQGYFLEAMGIVPRIDILKKKLKKEEQQRLESEYDRLVLPSEMGEIYKVQIISKKQYGDLYPFIEVDDHQF